MASRILPRVLPQVGLSVPIPTIAERMIVKERLALLDFALNQVHEAVYLLDRQGGISYVNDEACRSLGYARSELERLTVADIDPSWSSARWADAWDNPHHQHPVTVETFHCRRDGTHIPVEITASYFVYQGTRYKLAFARDITERRRAQGMLMHRERAFRTLVEHVPDIVMRYDNDFRKTYVNPAYEREIGASSSIASQPGQDPPWWGNMTQEACQSVLRQVMDTGIAKQLCVTWPDAEGRPAEYQLHVVAEIDLEDTVCGALAIGRNITPLKEAERRLEASHTELRELAAHVDVALEEERKHIARELHDELGQFLSALRMQLSVLRMQSERPSPPVAERAQSMLSLVDRVISVVRNLIASLRPAVLDMGIGSALEWLGAEFSQHTSVACRVYLDEASHRVDADQTIVIFRMVQEALTNVTRHAHASCVDISMVCHRNTFVLSVKDNGKGFDASLQPPNSFGLLGLRERAQMLNGHLEVISNRNGGTLIRVVFPTEGGRSPRSKAAVDLSELRAEFPSHGVGES